MGRAGRLEGAEGVPGIPKLRGGVKRRTMCGVGEKMGVEAEITQGGFWTTKSGMEVRGKNVAARGRCRSRHLTTARYC